MGTLKRTEMEKKLLHRGRASAATKADAGLLKLIAMGLARAARDLDALAAGREMAQEAGLEHGSGFTRMLSDSASSHPTSTRGDPPWPSTPAELNAHKLMADTRVAERLAIEQRCRLGF